jgi:hypothetical protein
MISAIFWFYATFMAFAGPISLVFLWWAFQNSMNDIDAELRRISQQFHTLESKYEETRAASISYHSQLARKEAEVIYLRGILKQEKPAPELPEAGESEEADDSTSI